MSENCLLTDLCLGLSFEEFRLSKHYNTYHLSSYTAYAIQYYLRVSIPHNNPEAWANFWASTLTPNLGLFLAPDNFTSLVFYQRSIPYHFMKVSSMFFRSIWLVHAVVIYVNVKSLVNSNVNNLVNRSE